jgi:hypothetical protein
MISKPPTLLGAFLPHKQQGRPENTPTIVTISSYVDDSGVCISQSILVGSQILAHTPLTILTQVCVLQPHSHKAANREAWHQMDIAWMWIKIQDLKK